MMTITARELNQHTGRVLDTIEATGEPVMVTRRGRPLVRIEPVTEVDDPIQRLIDAGLAIPAADPNAPLPPPVPTRSGLTVEELLAEIDSDH
jgi:prevent-host-death family protein